MNRQHSKYIYRAVFFVILFMIFSDFCCREFGILDIPLYITEEGIEYLPKPNQSGKFLRYRDWYFNNESMPIKENWMPKVHPNTLLIGNSIVMGGNPFRQNEKLTPILQSIMGHSDVIWPIAVGGWTELNELAFLERQPELIDGSDNIAWEFMSGGLSSATMWSGEYAFPTKRPRIAVLYVIGRYLLPLLSSSLGENELPVLGAPKDRNIRRFASMLARFAKTHPKHSTSFIWLYPKRDELAEARSGKKWLPEASIISSLANKFGFRVVDIATCPQWTSDLYRNDGVHPNQKGNEILASILARELTEKSQQERCPAAR